MTNDITKPETTRTAAAQTESELSCNCKTGSALSARTIAQIMWTWLELSTTHDKLDTLWGDNSLLEGYKHPQLFGFDCQYLQPGSLPGLCLAATIVSSGMLQATSFGCTFEVFITYLFEVFITIIKFLCNGSSSLLVFWVLDFYWTALGLFYSLIGRERSPLFFSVHCPWLYFSLPEYHIHHCACYVHWSPYVEHYFPFTSCSLQNDQTAVVSLAHRLGTYI